MDMTSNAITYRRVSTDEQADSGLGLDAQATAIDRTIEARGWTVAAALSDEGVSGSIAPTARPALADALRMLAAGEADALVVAKLDRATRSVADLCHLLDLSDRQGWDFIALDLGIDTSTPMGRAMAQMAGVFSELERKMIGQRTSDALQALKASGRRLGRPVEQTDDVRQRIAVEHAEGRSLRSIANDLNAENVPTARGGNWHASTIRRVLDSIDPIRRNLERFPNARRLDAPSGPEAGPWVIPIDDLLGAGYSVNAPSPPDEEPEPELPGTEAADAVELRQRIETLETEAADHGSAPQTLSATPEDDSTPDTPDEPPRTDTDNPKSPANQSARNRLGRWLMRP